jgi:hypothetical protein
MWIIDLISCSQNLSGNINGAIQTLEKGLGNLFNSKTKSSEKWALKFSLRILSFSKTLSFTVPNISISISPLLQHPIFPRLSPISQIIISLAAAQTAMGCAEWKMAEISLKFFFEHQKNGVEIPMFLKLHGLLMRILWAVSSGKHEVVNDGLSLLFQVVGYLKTKYYYFDSYISTK